jgi:hypothetical protein
LVPIRNDEGSETQFPQKYYLKEWEEARGTLKHINHQEGSLTFQRFIVQLPSNFSAQLSDLQSLIDQNVSVLRTDSAIHVNVQVGNYLDAPAIDSPPNPSASET